MNRYAAAVTWRNFLVWRRHATASLVDDIGHPLLFYLGFGAGLGAVLETMGGLSYIVFVTPGLIAFAAIATAAFEGAIGGYWRCHVGRNWRAQLATPVRLGELVAGELSWCVLKSLTGVLAMAVAGLLWGGVGSLPGLGLAIGVAALGAACFGASALLGVAYAKGWGFFSYFFTFWITPNYLFSGGFFALENYPLWIQAIAWTLPGAHLIAALRPLTAGVAVDAAAFALHLGYLTAFTAIAFDLARRRFARVLMD